jgi:hypothetical protein
VNTLSSHLQFLPYFMDFFAVLLTHPLGRSLKAGRRQIPPSTEPTTKAKSAGNGHGAELGDSISERRVRTEETRENLPC